LKKVVCHFLLWKGRMTGPRLGLSQENISAKIETFYRDVCDVLGVEELEQYC